MQTPTNKSNEYNRYNIPMQSKNKKLDLRFLFLRRVYVCMVIFKSNQTLNTKPCSKVQTKINTKNKNKRIQTNQLNKSYQHPIHLLQLKKKTRKYKKKTKQIQNKQKPNKNIHTAANYVCKKNIASSLSHTNQT